MPWDRKNKRWATEILCECGNWWTTDEYCPHVLDEKKYGEVNASKNKKIWDGLEKK